jgi:hypothetical protein
MIKLPVFSGSVHLQKGERIAEIKKQVLIYGLTERLNILSVQVFHSLRLGQYNPLICKSTVYPWPNVQTITTAGRPG